jgi:hypothetical protein
MKPIDYTPLEKNKKYRGKYLAVKETPGKITVIAFGKDLKKVIEEAQAKGCKVPLVTRIAAKKPTAAVFYNA